MLKFQGWDDVTINDIEIGVIIEDDKSIGFLKVYETLDDLYIDYPEAKEEQILEIHFEDEQEADRDTYH